MRKKPITMGIDVGAISTEAVVLRGEETLAYTIVPTGARVNIAARRCFRSTLEKANITREEIRSVVATGYGRRNLTFADSSITEITSHSRGAIHLFPGTGTVIDIGGQDTKIIFLKEGAVRDFVMNDRCAAGTGRFLEVMAHALEIPLERMGDESLRARRGNTVDTRISSTCTVFAESEVVSLLAEGKPRSRIILAIHEAIAERILAMAHRFRLGKRITLSGGVAKNSGVVDCIHRRLGVPLNIPDEPQLVGALGAALFARDRLRGLQ